MMSELQERLKALKKGQKLPPVFSVDGHNCYDTALAAREDGDVMVYGFARAPDEALYSHTWLRRNGEIVDLFAWTDHTEEGEWSM